MIFRFALAFIRIWDPCYNATPYDLVKASVIIGIVSLKLIERVSLGNRLYPLDLYDQHTPLRLTRQKVIIT